MRRDTQLLATMPVTVLVIAVGFFLIEDGFEWAWIQVMLGAALLTFKLIRWSEARRL